MNIEDYFYYKSIGWTHKEIADRMGVARCTLYNWIKEDYSWSSRKPIKLLQFIEKSLVGDGSIVMRGDIATFQMSSSNLTYLEWLKSELEKLELKSTIGHYLYKKENSGYKSDCDIYYLRSRACSSLVELRKKWYPNGKKVMPVDFIWDNDALVRFICEDGSSRYSYECYWGEKDEDTFKLFESYIKDNHEFISSRKSTSGGMCIKFRANLKLLPGYEYKQL